MEKATLGAGCFWCVEVVYQHIEGVEQVMSGYMGGHTDKPSYEEVCRGDTGHAEVVQISFDPEVVSYRELVDIFWRIHDPTSLNRQGGDVGTQYRSVIFYHDEAQRETAEASKKDIQPHFDRPIVTELSPAGTFYEAEPYHQDYYKRNPGGGYCQFVILPKLQKLGMA